MIESRQHIYQNAISVLKGIAIILMVVGHTAFQYKSYIYLFHMACFFIASGYLFKSNYSESIKDIGNFIKRRIKSLWLPYFISNSIFIVLNNIFLGLNIYTSDKELLAKSTNTNMHLHHLMSLGEIIKEIIKAALFRVSTQMGGATWFFKTLFLLSVTFVIIDYFICKIILVFANWDKDWNIIIRCLMHSLIAIGFLLLGFYEFGSRIWIFEKILGIGECNKILSYYFLFVVGQWSGIINRKITLSSMESILIIILSAASLMICNKIGTVALSSNEYYSPIFFITVSIFGWVLLYTSASLICNFSIRLKYILSIVSNASVEIVALHLLSFKIISLLIVSIKHIPVEYLAVYPTIEKEYYWWFLYAIVGIMIPILFKKGKAMLYAILMILRSKKSKRT